MQTPGVHLRPKGRATRSSFSFPHSPGRSHPVRVVTGVSQGPCKFGPDVRLLSSSSLLRYGCLIFLIVPKRLYRGTVSTFSVEYKVTSVFCFLYCFLCVNSSLLFTGLCFYRISIYPKDDDYERQI